jgi:hypothetical protein
MRLISLFILILILAACGAEPPAPLPEVAPQVAPEHVAWLPVVTTPKVEPVRGWAKAYSNLSNAELERLGVGWYYDYALRYPFPKRGNVEYVPFLWCDIYPSLAYGKPTIRYFDALQKLPADYGGYLLFLNEPDLQGSTIDGGQCERTPRQGAYMLKAARELCPGCIIVGPAVSHEDYRAGWKWLRAFCVEALRIGVTLPEVSAIHTYLPGDPARIVDSHFALLAEFPGAATTAWVTEFATSSPAQARRMIDYYEADPRITRYAWFTAAGWRDDMVLLDAERQTTPVGEAWVGSPYP